MDEYVVKRYDVVGANEEPSKVVEVHGLKNLIKVVFEQVKKLTNETNEVSFGDAGEKELFEVFPEIGNGTVVVEESYFIQEDS